MELNPGDVQAALARFAGERAALFDVRARLSAEHKGRRFYREASDAPPIVATGLLPPRLAVGADACSKHVSRSGKPYYLDHHSGNTSWFPPRGAGGGGTTGAAACQTKGMEAHYPSGAGWYVRGVWASWAECVRRCNRTCRRQQEAATEPLRPPPFLAGESNWTVSDDDGQWRKHGGQAGPKFPGWFGNNVDAPQYYDPGCVGYYKFGF